MVGRIGVVGSCMTDLVVEVARLPGPGETLGASGFAIGQGGKGANQAVAAARLGSDVLMIAKVGDDGFGTATIESLTRAGIDTAHVNVVPGVSSGIATIVVEADGQNRIMIARGANDCLLPDDIEKAGRSLLGCDLVLLQLENPLQTIYRVIDFAAERGKRVILNPAPATPDLDLSRICRAEFLVPNQSELGLMTGLPADTRDEAAIAARRLVDLGARNVIVTLGGEGALLLTAETTTHVPVPEVPVRDTTGAGDACIGAFAHFLAAGTDVLRALRLATLYAADAVTRPGAQRSFADANAFDEFRRRMDQKADGWAWAELFRSIEIGGGDEG